VGRAVPGEPLNHHPRLAVRRAPSFGAMGGAIAGLRSGWNGTALPVVATYGYYYVVTSISGPVTVAGFAVA